jgi:hypothetical protein
MLHIIGLNYSGQAQYRELELTEDQQAFSDCLLRTIKEVQPAFIAEEDSIFSNDWFVFGSYPTSR